MESADILSRLPVDQRPVIAAMVEALAALPGVDAVALGGSHARGTARPDSDVDLALYYRQEAPPSIADIRALAARFDAAGTCVVTDFYEWGPWVNGGAWIHTRAVKVDWLYRNLDQVRRVIDEASAGRLEWHFGQQPTFGFYSVIYLAESRVCVPLHDPSGALRGLKDAVAVYPEPLRASIVREWLWGAEFSLYHARGHAQRGDVYNTVGCITRTLSYLTQVLFGLNRVYFISDKGALEAIDAFGLRPEGYGATVRAILAAPGATTAELTASVECLGQLFGGVVALAGDLYRPKFAM